MRGLDYYTKTVFEFINSKGQTLCGGGRYDNLVNEIGEKDVPAVGFGFGIERMLMALENEKIDLHLEQPVQLYVGVLGEVALQDAMILVNNLRKSGIKTETDYLGRSVKAQMKYANKIGAIYTLILGENEINNKKENIKNMKTGKQEKIEISEIITYINKKIEFNQ